MKSEKEKRKKKPRSHVDVTRWSLRECTDKLQKITDTKRLLFLKNKDRPRFHTHINMNKIEATRRRRE